MNKRFRNILFCWMNAKMQNVMISLHWLTPAIYIGRLWFVKHWCPAGRWHLFLFNSQPITSHRSKRVHHKYLVWYLHASTPETIFPFSDIFFFCLLLGLNVSFSKKPCPFHFLFFFDWIFPKYFYKNLPLFFAFSLHLLRPNLFSSWKFPLLVGSKTSLCFSICGPTYVSNMCLFLLSDYRGLLLVLAPSPY